MRNKIKIFILGIILLGAVVLGLCLGSVNIPLADLFKTASQPILQLRIARVILAVLAGAGLGCCGVLLQAILRNPLAEPYLLGTSSGGGLGAVLGIIFGLPAAFLPLSAFIVALISVFIVYLLAREGGRVAAQSLILSGVIVGMAISGIVVFLVAISNNIAVHGMMWWLLGSLQVYDPNLLGMVAVIVVICIGIIYFFSQDLNAMSLGEEEALHLGIDVEKIKRIMLVVTALATGALVSVSGMIGFVGLIVPHIMRSVVGPNHKILIPATCLAGAAFLVLCDTLARTLMPPIEIPIGMVTSLIGTPVFIILLKRKQQVK